MSSDATLGFGSQIYKKNGSDADFVKIAQSKDLNSPESEIAKVKITNNDSPNNSQEYVPGLIDPGSLEFEWIYTKAQQAILYADWAARVAISWKEVFPDGSGWTFTGFLTKISNETKTEDEAIMGKVSITLTTAAVFAATVS